MTSRPWPPKQQKPSSNTSSTGVPPRGYENPRANLPHLQPYYPSSPSKSHPQLHTQHLAPLQPPDGRRAASNSFDVMLTWCCHQDVHGVHARGLLLYGLATNQQPSRHVMALAHLPAEGLGCRFETAAAAAFLMSDHATYHALVLCGKKSQSGTVLDAAACAAMHQGGMWCGC